MAPRLGGRIGQGGSAEVFAWDAGRVLKLFRPEYAYAVEREAECAGAVNRAGVACPAVTAWSRSTGGAASSSSGSTAPRCSISEVEEPALRRLLPPA
jgi:hypothetical protein